MKCLSFPLEVMSRLKINQLKNQNTMKILSKNARGVVLLILGLVGVHGTSSVAAPYETPDYYLCYNRVGGEWNFGRVPSACDVTPWGDPAYVEENFAPVIFNDNTERGAERQRYMQEVHAMLRESVAYYLLARKPDASEAEVLAWQRANFAKAHQETFWTHYRDATDGNLKMVRGDYGHGHGMVQIDDRWHFPKLEEGKGWHIFENIIYGMELFYDAWEDAVSASCVSSADNWRDRARSAYSVYNGGASKICRWTDPNDVWAGNDIGFADKYDSQTWLNYVVDPLFPTSLDVACFMEGNPGCSAVAPVDADDPANWPGRQVYLTSGESCRFEGGAFECVDNPADMMCLSIVYGAPTGTSISPTAEATAAYTKNVYDRHSCFGAAVTGLSTVGQTIRSEIAINVRATPGGSAMGFASQAGKVYQVLDFVVSDINSQYRYYMIRENNRLGYIYAGKVSDFGNWTSPAPYSELEDVLIPQVEDKIRVVPESGINLRSAPDGALVANVPAGAKLKVDSVVVRGVDNSVYYGVQFQNNAGYLYGGKVLNGMTLKDWIMLDGEEPGKDHAEAGDIIQLATGINLRDVPGGSWLVTVPRGSLLYVHSIVIQGTNDYLYYEVTYNGHRGFLYGGQLEGTRTIDNWAVLASLTLADSGDKLLLRQDVEQRVAPAGDLIQVIPEGTKVKVITSVVMGDNNDVYYQVKYEGQTGFIFAGHLTPASTLGDWSETVKEK